MRKYREKLVAMVEGMKEGTLIPWAIEDARCIPGYWDKHIDFRTNKPNPPPIQYVERDGITAHTRSHAPSSCPSGPCGQRSEIIGIVTPSAWEVLFEQHFSHFEPPKSYEYMKEWAKRNALELAYEEIK